MIKRRHRIKSLCNRKDLPIQTAVSTGALSYHREARVQLIPLLSLGFLVYLCAPTTGMAQVPPATESEPAVETKSVELPPSALTPPVIKTSVAPIYPETEAENGQKSRVVLKIRVSDRGIVTDVEVVSTGGSLFDEAATAAVKQWTFTPAKREDVATASTLTLPFLFTPPAAEPAVKRPAANRQTDAPANDMTEDDDLLEVPAIEVMGKNQATLRDETRSASDFRLERDVLIAAPRREGADMLRSAPGVFIGRGEGPAVAHRYMLRGFDADHGQDIDFRVGGLPINIPSHIHGQGYSDLSFLVGDVVQELQVKEGVYDPRQGDFAVAGSIQLDLGVGDDERGTRVRTGYGAFNAVRALTLWAPEDSPEETFGVVRYTRTDGFGENRAGQSGSAIVQHRFGEDDDISFRIIGILHAARSNLAGVLRKDDIDSGRVCFTCVYSLPTAQAQNALAIRFLTGFFADFTGEESNGQLGLWLGYDSFRLQRNFTGFIERSQVLESVAGRGDLIEQNNRTFSLGLTGRYRSAPFRPASWANGTVEVGMDGRIDVIEQSQNLIDATVRSQTWDNRVDANILGVDVGLWGDLNWEFTEYVRIRAGMRADVLSYNIDDALGNFVAATRPDDSFIPGFRRSALGLAWGPRTSLEVIPADWVTLHLAYGEGYRSPQARLLEDGEQAPYTKVRSADFGVRFDWGDPLQLTVSAYYTLLSDDVAFDAGEGRLERTGETQRIGAALHAVSRPLDWLVASVSFTFVEATLLEPPPATAEEPQPPYTKGQNLPFVPPIVVRADLGAKHTFIEDLGGQPFGGRLGLGYSFLSPRPLPYGDFADPVNLLDASAALSWGPIELAAEFFNVINSQYSEVEYMFTSDWTPNDGVRSRTPARHISAGSPFSWMLTLGVTI